MNLFKQLKLTLIDAPISLRRLKKGSFVWGAIYSLSTFIVFGLFVWLMLSNQQAIKELLLDYLFPKSWQNISEKLVEFLFESQAKVVLSNMILSGSLVLASITLFPVKEKYSAAFEQDGDYQNGAIKEFPLFLQAWEEVKLFLLYLTAQSVILWIGYYPYQWTTFLAISLSYLFLFFTFGLDIIAPTLQRHRINYSLMLKYFLAHPLLTCGFGLLFSFPLLVIAHYVFKQPELTFIEMTSILFLVNILFLSIAIPSGTHLASRVLSEIRVTHKPTISSVRKSYLAMSILLIFTLFLHSRLIISLHHKSQLLKAEYDLDWSSIEFDMPSLSQIANGKALSQFSIDMVIHNPTQFDILIEPSVIQIQQDKKSIASIDINGFYLASGEKKRINLELNSNSDLSLLSELPQLLEGWRVDMYLDLWPGIPFILNLIDDNNQK